MLTDNERTIFFERDVLLCGCLLGLPAPLERGLIHRLQCLYGDIAAIWELGDWEGEVQCNHRVEGKNLTVKSIFSMDLLGSKGL